MSDYTPTTDVIRDACTFQRDRLGEPRPISPEAFQRWLDSVCAEQGKAARAAYNSMLNARTLWVGADALHRSQCQCEDPDHYRAWKEDVRVVLTAIKEAMQ